MSKPQILVVDDESGIRHILHSTLEMKDCDVRSAGSAEEALDILAGWEPEVALVDIVLPGKNGIQLLGEIKQAYRDTEVLVLTSNASADTALQAIRLGAYDYLKKPFELEDIWGVVHRALERRGLNIKSRDVLQQQEQKSLKLSSEVSFSDPADPQPNIEPVVEIADDFIGLLARELNVHQAALMLIDGERVELRVVASRGMDETGPFSVKLGEGFAGTVAVTGQPAIVPGADNGDGSRMCVPLRTERETLGVIQVAHPAAGMPFDTEHLSHLTRMSNQLTRTIEQARRADQLHKAWESLKTAQDQLVHVERIKAVGQMAAGVAHDFNNVLGVILARAEFILQKLDEVVVDRKKLRHHTETIIKTAMQGAEAIKRVQDYTRIRKGVAATLLDLNATIRDAVEISRPKWKEESNFAGRSIDICMELGDVPGVSGNQYELTQVFSNLLFNAVEAMPDGGQIWFRSFTEEDRVVVEIQDSGVGMDEETRRRLFEPFFSTKEKGQGLGTSILYGIVTRHGGTITVESEPGVGTTFRIALPRAKAGMRETRSDTVEPVRKNRATILVVDDNELVRETFEELLSVKGHQVQAAAGGEEALELLEGQGFDVVVVDLNMQGMSGIELAEKITRRRPDFPIILCSGGTVDEQDEAVRAAGIDCVLLKPVTIEQLESAVQQVTQGVFQA